MVIVSTIFYQFACTSAVGLCYVVAYAAYRYISLSYGFDHVL